MLLTLGLYLLIGFGIYLFTRIIARMAENAKQIKQDTIADDWPIVLIFSIFWPGILVTLLVDPFGILKEFSPPEIPKSPDSNDPNDPKSDNDEIDNGES